MEPVGPPLGFARPGEEGRTRIRGSRGWPTIEGSGGCRDAFAAPLLLAPPLLLAVLEIFHPQPDFNAQALMDASTWFALSPRDPAPAHRAVRAVRAVCSRTATGSTVAGWATFVPRHRRVPSWWSSRHDLRCRRRPLVGDRRPDPAPMRDLRLADGRGTATTLSDRLPVTRQAVAKHLGVLDRVGLVHVTPVGREMRYRVDDAQLARAAAQLADVGCDLGRQAAAHQADRRDHPAHQRRVESREGNRTMVDILHRVAVEVVPARRLPSSSPLVFLLLGHPAPGGTPRLRLSVPGGAVPRAVRPGRAGNQRVGSPAPGADDPTP